MKKTFFQFTLDPTITLEYAWDELSNAGIDVAYGSEDEAIKLLFGYWNTQQPLPTLESVILAEESTLPTIDWESQWQQHGHNFSDGFIHVDLSLFGGPHKTLILQPGPGFGDLSHPTTQLTLQLMTQLTPSETVVDIGCGSGILSLAAVALGAKKVYGIDIDTDALDHSRKNSELNAMNSHCTFLLPEDFNKMVVPPTVLIVMNMISSEQKEAWKALTVLHKARGTIITSGIRAEERDLYLEQASQLGWKLDEDAEKDGWMGFIFIQNSP